jgi:pimeloyl-ACP methyl ester carboxylesterase
MVAGRRRGDARGERAYRGRPATARAPSARRKQGLAERLGSLLPEARTLTIPGTGHVPHETDPTATGPDRYAPVIARHALAWRAAAY